MSILKSRLVQKPYQVFHYYFLAEQNPSSTLANLDLSTDVSATISKLRSQRPSVGEAAHFGFLWSVIAFVLVIFPAPFLIKFAILAMFIACFLVPLTSQFFVHALPIFTWLALFFSCGKIPHSWKPAITVKFLPAMETILYGDNLSNVLATFHTTLLDIIAWIPYGIIHFSVPFVLAVFIFVFAPPTSLRCFGFAFGYMNLLGVMTQLLFPAAPPWYKNLYGLQPANYSMTGSPGGLGRIDAIVGFDMYTTNFSTSPVIFGAFPSLHSGCAVMEALFLSWLFPKLKFVWWGYVCWLWWSTMYLTHHYFIDLIGGAFFAYVVFTYTKHVHLPVIDHNCFCRWSYTEIKKPDVNVADPLAFENNAAYNEFIYHDDIENVVTEHIANFPYLNQATVPEPIELTAIQRSRQASRTFLPSIQGDDAEIETSSMENGATSVFDDNDNVITNSDTNTSVEEFDENFQPTPSTKYNKKSKTH